MLNEKDVRNALGRFLFSGDDVLKPVTSLSGGEKGRLALAKLMLLKANTLVLDEPTNHLDLDSKEVLENALLDFPGTLLFVSHDRYFINRIATKVVELSPTGSHVYLGDYDYYLEKKEEELELKQLAQIEANQSTPTPVVTTTQIDKSAKKRERQITRRVTELEDQLAVLEQKKAVIEEELCKPEVFGDHEQVASLNAELEVIQDEHDTLSMEWLELQEELETL